MALALAGCFALAAVKYMKNYAYLKSPIGILEIVSDNQNILAINFVKKTKSNNHNALTKQCVVQLQEYFAGQRQVFDLPVKITGSPWQVRTCFELSKIPYGTIISYQDLAAMGGNVKAARSVGQAVNKNKIPIIIPCHRVVGTRGQLVGYAGGLWRKQVLLELERSFD